MADSLIVLRLSEHRVYLILDYNYGKLTEQIDTVLYLIYYIGIKIIKAYNVVTQIQKKKKTIHDDSD